MNGVPRYMAYYVGATGRNRRSKLMDRLKRVVPDDFQRSQVMAILKECEILYLLKHTKE